MKLLYSVLDERGHEWKKRFSSMIMQRALVDPLDRIFEEPKYTDDVKIVGIKRRRGPYPFYKGSYNIINILSQNGREKDERLVLLTFDDYLSSIRAKMTMDEFEKKKDKKIHGYIPLRDLKPEYAMKHEISKEGVEIVKTPKEREFSIIISSGGATMGNNSIIASFADKLNIYPLPFLFIEEDYSFIVTHELADTLLDECKDKGPCIKKGSEDNIDFGKKCKKELEKLYL